MARKVRVTRKQVDAAAAEVRAFRVAGLTPDPLVVRIADAGSAGTPKMTAAAPKAPDRLR